VALWSKGNKMSSTKTGVTYQESDYASLSLRAITILIDAALITPLLLVSYYLDDYLYQNYYTDSTITTLYFTTFIAYMYLTVIKASNIGTLGQKLTKTKILHISGRKQNMFHMTFRLFFWFFGLFNFISDFAWVTLNNEKRTLRDSMCNTIVVKLNAVPVTNESEIKNIRVMFFGLHFLYDTAKP